MSFETVPEPRAAAGYEFSLPFPAQSKGGMSEECGAGESTGVALYQRDGESWEGPLTGPVYRYPLNSYRSGKIAGGKGIAVQLGFTGGEVIYGGQTLIQSVFFHDEPCYRAATEFGFDRYLQGRPTDGTVYFYYEIHANCKPDGKCRDRQNGITLADRRESVPLKTPRGENSRGRSEWLYEAYLDKGGAVWAIQIRDPYSNRAAAPPLPHAIKDFWQAAGRRFFESGTEGYVTATSMRNGTVAYSGDMPMMNVARVAIVK
jgi:hypothetical protein